MLNRILFLFLAGVCLPIGKLQAQTVWTLDECIAYALSHNISLKRQRLDIEESRITLQQSKLDYIPSVKANSGYNVSVGRVLDPTTYSFIENNTVSDFNATATVSTDLFAGFKKHYAKQRAELALKAALASSAQAENDLALNITAAYLEVLLADESIGIAEHKITILQAQGQQTRQLVDAGKITFGELLQVQTQIAEARTELLSAQTRREMAGLKICQMLEIEEYDSFRAVNPELIMISETIFTEDFDDLQAATQSLPQIERAELEIEIAAKELATAKAALYPTLILTGGYGSSYSDARQKVRTDATGNPVMNVNNELLYANYPWLDQIRDNASAYISLSLNIPIFNGRQAKNKVRMSRIAQQRAEYNLLLARKELDKQIQQALIDARMALQKYHASQANVSTNEESFHYMRQKLDAGAATYVDYQVALDNLTKAQSQLLQSKYEYIMRKEIIRFYKFRTFAN
ncbi:TolC family protein [uncultured Alistipes sp.]|uniref:TolC family protein n=1 Tax=uncultured Alistipes sp. TaxID=538949 RepID=UPI00261BCFCC|nr:TolC family protein [uncultured Alistipes sp.]